MVEGQEAMSQFTLREADIELERIRLAMWNTMQAFAPSTNEYKKAKYLWQTLSAQKYGDIEEFADAVHYNPIQVGVPSYHTIHALGVVSCQCEHEAHFDTKAEQDPLVGHSCHKYMAEFAPSYITKVHTIYGWYEMCKDCAHSLPTDMRVS